MDRFRIREACLRQYAQGHPAFANQASALARACYRYSALQAMFLLEQHFESGVTKEVLMHMMLLWVMYPGINGTEVEEHLLAEFGQVCHE